MVRKVITRTDLEAANAFFRVLNGAVRDHKVRCVFVTRQDIEWGKRVVLLDDATEVYLLRLPQTLVESEISRVVSGDAIEHPANGWVELRRRLCEDLSDGGILPVQMRFAVLGLEAVRDNLTTHEYLRKGRDKGLISEHLEKEIRLVAGSGPLAHSLFGLLNELVSPDGKSTVPVSERVLLARVPEDSKGKTSAALEQLGKRDIVERVSATSGDVLWRLDHDYLAGPVREIRRRQSPEWFELKEGYERFRRALPRKKVFALAGPLTLSRLLRAKLLRRLRFGESIAWILLSVSMILTVAALMLSIGAYAVRSFQAPQQAETLFGVFGESSGPNQKETDALHALLSANRSVRARFLRIALETEANAVRIASHKLEISLAITRLDPAEARKFIKDEIFPALRHGGNVEVRVGASLMIALEAGVLLSSREAAQISDGLRSRMRNETDFDLLRALTFALGALGPKLSGADADAAIKILIAHLHTDPVLSRFGACLARDVGEISPQATPSATVEASEVLWAQMRNERNPYALHCLAESFAALGPNVSNAASDNAVKLLVARMHTETNDESLQLLAEGLGSNKQKLSAPDADEAAELLLDRISTEVDTDRLVTLLKSFDMLVGEISPEAADHAAKLLAKLLAERAKTETKVTAALVGTLGALGPKISTPAADEAAKLLVGSMCINPSGDLSTGFIALGPKLSAPTANETAKLLLGRILATNNAELLNLLASGLGAIGHGVNTSAILDASEFLLARMNGETDSSSLVYLGHALGGLGSNVSTTAADQAAKLLLARMRTETDAGLQMHLAYSLGRLGQEVSMPTIDEAAKLLIARIRSDVSPEHLRWLGRGLASLKAKLDPKSLTSIPTLFTIADAPCAVVLGVPREAIGSFLTKQLMNPGCDEDDWQSLALEAAQIAGKPIAVKDTKAPHKITVHFASLSEYVSKNGHWYELLRFAWTDWLSLSLFAAAVVALAIGLAKLRASELHGDGP
jgi:hypothetical protein